MASNASKETENEDVFYFTYHVFAEEILFALALARLSICCSAVSSTTAAASWHHHSLLHKVFFQEKLMKTVCSGNQTQKN